MYSAVADKALFMGKPLEIVVVDDEEQITELIKTFIEITSDTAQVHTFTDSLQAKEYLLRNPVDMLITDYKMPNCDGIQLLEVVPDTVKKILISGYVSEFAERKLSKMNVTVFEKPVPIRALKRLLGEQEAVTA